MQWMLVIEFVVFLVLILALWEFLDPGEITFFVRHFLSTVV